MSLIKFTQPGCEVAVKRGEPARTLPATKVTLRADCIHAIEEPRDAGDFVQVRTDHEIWEVTETYEAAVALWSDALRGAPVAVSA